jgi:DNA-binding response OmpR family regulator
MIFSAKAVAEYEQRARSLGVTNYVKKPSDPDHLLNEINMMLK